MTITQDKRVQNRTQIDEGAWYVPSITPTHSRPRWVLKHFAREGVEMVRYATGGDAHRICERKSFVFWMGKQQAKKNLEIPIHVDPRKADAGQDPLLRDGAASGA